MGIRIPHPLLDCLIEKYNLKNDAALARMLELAPPDISRIRNGHRPVSSAMILQIHDITEWPIKDIKALLQ